MGWPSRGSSLLAHGDLPAVGSKYWYPVRVPFVVGVVHPAKHHQAAILPQHKEGVCWRRIMPGNV